MPLRPPRALLPEQAELRYRSRLLELLLKANQIDALSGEPIERRSVAE